MVAKRKSKKNSFNKSSRKIITNHRLIKNLIAGAFSPVSASRKIQSMSRGRLIRQSRKAEQLGTLLNQGAPIYKRALQTLDFRGINMSNQVLSRRVLDGSKFQKVDFSKSKINGAKFNQVNAVGANFTNAELKKTVANGSNFEKAKFNGCDMLEFKSDYSNFSNTSFIFTVSPCNLRGSVFKYCDFKKADFSRTSLVDTQFIDCSMKGSTFINTLSGSGVSPPVVGKFEIKRCNVDEITLISSPHIFANIKNPPSNIINSLKIIPFRLSERQSCLQKFTHSDITFNNLDITNILFRDSATFNNCTFRELQLNYSGNMDDSTSTDRRFVQFFQATFDNCSFLNCDFGKFMGHSSQYIRCTFDNCNLSKCDLRSGDFSNSTFINCNMDGVKFVRSKLTGVNFIDGTVLSNIDFQECEGMDGMSFQGLNMQGARMIGITDPGLNACNFRDANLRGVQFDFSQIHGSDFTGADLTGSNVRVAEGSDQTVGIPEDQEEGRTVDTHKTFYKIRTNMLLDFYIEKADIESPYTAPSDNALRELALSTLSIMVTNLDTSETDKRELMTSLEACFTQQLNRYNFGQIIAGTEPHVDFRKLIYCVIKYLEKQPKEFKDIYVESLIMDSAHAYGRGGMSCAAGIVERFVTVMEQAAAVVRDTVPEKAEEYTELMNIITNDPKSLIKAYQQEWFEFHKEGGPNAFAESAALDTIMKSYKDFLEEKFDFANLRGPNKEKIRRLIMDDPNAGVNITREYIENSVLFFGGRVKDNRHLNYFKMLKERFYIKDRYTKSTTRKHRGKKHKKKPTRAKKHRRHKKF